MDETLTYTSKRTTGNVGHQGPFSPLVDENAYLSSAIGRCVEIFICGDDAHLDPIFLGQGQEGRTKFCLQHKLTERERSRSLSWFPEENTCTSFWLNAPKTRGSHASETICHSGHIMRVSEMGLECGGQKLVAVYATMLSCPCSLPLDHTCFIGMTRLKVFARELSVKCKKNIGVDIIYGCFSRCFPPPPPSPNCMVCASIGRKGCREACHRVAHM